MKYPKSAFVYLIFGVVLLTAGCQEGASPEVEVPVGITDFFDGFETDTPELDLLFPEDNSRWTNLQQVDPGNNSNTAELSQVEVETGTQSLRLFAGGSLDPLSKMDIEKGGFAALYVDNVSVAVRN